MMYIFFIDVVMLLVLLQIFKAMNNAFRGVNPVQNDVSPGLDLLIGIGVLALGLFPMAIVFLWFSSLTAEVHSPNEFNWFPWLTLGMGICTILLFGARYLLKRQDRAIKNTVAFAFAMFAGLYFVIAAADHFWFYRDPSVNFSGDVSYFKVEDVPCEGTVIARIEGDAMRYRCPQHEMLMFGPRFGNSQFVPWLTYTEGQSTDLKNKIEALFADAHSGTGN